MQWLWAAGPLIILGGAVWLAIGTRRLVGYRLDTSDDRHAEPSEAGLKLRESVARLHRDIEEFGKAASGDSGAGPVDR